MCSVNDIPVREGHVGALWLIQVNRDNTTYDLTVFFVGEGRAFGFVMFCLLS